MTDFGIRPPRYRLPEETRLGAVRLQVGDLTRSIRYYETVLGLRIAAGSAAAAGGVGLGPHQEDRVLVWLHERAGIRPVPRRGLLGLYHFAILLPDRAALGRFAAHLASIGVAAGSADHFVSEALYLSDPDGLGIEVYGDRPRASWRQQGGQLYMTTEPLDLQSVVAAAGQTPWTGMPPGTILGHVHLHVGELDRAAAFFHAGLGFDKTVWLYPGALFLSAGGYHHHLGTNTWSRGRSAMPEDARLLWWELVLPSPADADRAAASLIAEGFSAERAAGGWRALDPWGTELRLLGHADYPLV